MDKTYIVKLYNLENLRVVVREVVASNLDQAERLGKIGYAAWKVETVYEKP